MNRVKNEGEINIATSGMDQDNLRNREETPLISVIVPVYQVQAYLRECLDSLLQQTYENLEVILVDDGSTDGSGEICDEYERNDVRVQVIHQKNSGPSAARNTGLNCANGEYIAFVDGDDAVLSVYIERLYQILKQVHADVAICGFTRQDPEEIGLHTEQACTRRTSPESQVICMDSDQMLRQWHGRYKEYETVVWNKLYCASVWNGGQDRRRIRYPACKRDEDIIISHQIIQNTDRIALTRQVLYRYRYRTGSLTDLNVMIEHAKQNLSAQRERMLFFKEHKYWMAYCKLMAGYMLHVGWFGLKKAVCIGRKSR